MINYKDCYQLNNGLQIPCMGFGTYNAKDGDNREIIGTAIKAGYRYFDTASLYGTERDLGAAIRESGIPREEFFIVSKVWIDEMGYEEVKKAFAASLERLQMDYLDLYLIHWPRKSEDDTEWKKRLTMTWLAMEELYDTGKVRGLGLSNFLPHHIEVLMHNAKIKPVVDQLEIHPGYSQEAAVAYCKANNIQVQAWSPIGRSALLTNPYMMSLAEKYHVSVAQLCLRFLIQKGIIPLPKASTMERMKQNQDVFGFDISEEDMWILTCMPQNLWLGEHPDFAVPTATSEGKNEI
ncbi:MAG: aldo/keto reductase [Lachnospiraceae bacterium]|nr:aldo/keto reductase [Lachnospiraceae bacterium]